MPWAHRAARSRRSLSRVRWLRSIATLGLFASAPIVEACGLETSGWVLRELPEASPPSDAETDAIAADATDAKRDVTCGPCSGTVVLNGREDTGLQGADAGSIASDLCPEGEAVIGYKGTLNNSSLLLDGNFVTVIGRIQTVCGRLTLSSPSATTVSVSSSTMLDPHGGPGPNTWGLLCDANKVVVGFVGGSGNALDQLGIQCAQMLVTRSPGSPGTVTADMGTITTLPPIGGEAGAPFADGCRGGKVARGTNSRAPHAWIDAFGLICGAPAPVWLDAGSTCCGPAAQETTSRIIRPSSNP